MDISLTGIYGIKGKLLKIEKSIFAKQMMGDIGMFLMGAIKTRTAKGEDYTGLGFKPYNPLYAKERKKAGYQVGHVDLNRTGSMMSSMNSDYDSRQVELSFMNTRDPDGGSNPEKAFFLNEDREFFALSVSDYEKISAIVKVYYAKLMNDKI